MLIGVISDTHDQLTAMDKALAIFRDRRVDQVIHAGDLVAPFAAKRLKAGVTVPLHVIYGNNDGERKGLKAVLPQVQDGPLFVEAPGRRILVNHDLDSLAPEQVARADVIITGHTHERKIETKDGKLYLNPGECCGWLTGKASVVLLDPATLAVEVVEFVP